MATTCDRDRRIADVKEGLRYFQEGLIDSPEIEEEIRIFQEKLKSLREEQAGRKKELKND